MATNRAIKAHAAGFIAARKGQTYLAHRSGRKYKEASENTAYASGWVEGVTERKLLDATLASAKIARDVTEGLPSGWRIEVNGEALKITTPKQEVYEFLGRPNDLFADAFYDLCLGLSIVHGQPSKPEEIVVNPNKTAAPSERFAAKKFHVYKRDGSYLGEVSEFDVKGARAWAAFVFQVPASELGVSDVFMTPEEVAATLSK